MPNHIEYIVNGNFNGAEWQTYSAVLPDSTTYDITQQPASGTVTYDTTLKSFVVSGTAPGDDFFLYRPHLADGSFGAVKKQCITTIIPANRQTGYRARAGSSYCFKIEQIPLAYSVSGTSGDAFADANLNININGVDHIFAKGSTGSIGAYVGDTVIVKAFAHTPAVGSSPMLELFINNPGDPFHYDSGSLSANPPPDFIIIAPTFTVLSATSYAISAVSSAFDVHPDPFSFTNQTNLYPSTPTNSNTQTITGITTSVPITVTGGIQYAKNGGSFTNSSGTINNNDVVQLKNITSPSDSTAVSGTVTIGDRNQTWTITTGDTTPDAYAFTALIEQQLNTVVQSNIDTITGLTLLVPISITGGQYSLNGGAFTSANGTISNGDTVQVQLTTSASPNTLASCTLNINGVTATFNATTYHVLTVNIHISEQADPFSDANGAASNNGILISRDTGTGTTTHPNIQSRLTLIFDSFSETPTTGSAPTKTMSITRTVGGTTTTIYPSTTNSNNPGDPDLMYTETGVDNATYDMYVSSYAAAPVAPVSCGMPTTYGGGAGFPTDTIISLGAGTGLVNFFYDAQSIPDKFQVYFDGALVIDTGYKGDISQQTTLNAALAAMGLPPETITNGNIDGIGRGQTSFNKTTASTTALVRVYSPITGTAWTFNLQCPTAFSNKTINYSFINSNTGSGGTDTNSTLVYAQVKDDTNGQIIAAYYNQAHGVSLITHGTTFLDDGGTLSISYNDIVAPTHRVKSHGFFTSGNIDYPNPPGYVDVPNGTPQTVTSIPKANITQLQSDIAD